MPRRGSTAERHVALFLLGLVTLNPPLLSLFSGGGDLFGIPSLYIYLFSVWGSLIALMALTSEVRRPFRGPRRRSGPSGED